MENTTCSGLPEIADGLKKLYNCLMDWTESASKERRTEQQELIGDALDSLSEAIGCVEEALEEE